MAERIVSDVGDVFGKIESEIASIIETKSVVKKLCQRPRKEDY